MLTIKQSQLLNFLIKKIEESGTSPSYEEICIHLNLKSKSGIHRIVKGLVERDYIIKLNNQPGLYIQKNILMVKFILH